MPPAKIDVARLRQMIEADQMTQSKAAEILGCSTSCIERTIKRHGLKTQKAGSRNHGPRHPSWAGGTYLLKGYRYVWSPNHPNRTKANYVAEHRLVVEASIGRLLERHEVVHHKNGDPLDNKPENLEVFQSNPDHLRSELTGRVPNWTPDGKARISRGVQKAVLQRKHSRQKSKERGD